MQLSRKYFMVFFLASALLGQAYAVTVPEAKNPWLTTSANAADDPFAALMSEFPAQGSLPYEPVERERRIASDMEQISNQGDLRARLVFFGKFAHFERNKNEILDVFDKIDNLKDPKLLYEIAKIMQLRQSGCVTVGEKNGVKYAELNCSDPSGNSTKSAQLHNELNDRYIGYFYESALFGYAPAQYELALILLRKSEIPNNNPPATSLGGKSTLAWLAAANSLPEANSLLTKITDEDRTKKQQEKNEIAMKAENAAIKPACEFVRFTGIASAATPQLIEQALASEDIEDTLARNPIQCDRMMCYGITNLKNHKGRIVNWNERYLTVAAPIDFNTGRRDILLVIRRGDAVCQK